MNQNSPYQFNSDRGTPSYRQNPDSGYMGESPDNTNMAGKSLYSPIARISLH